MTEEEIRPGDVERDAVAARLKDQFAAGRLSIDELDQRLAEVCRDDARGVAPALGGPPRRCSPLARPRRFFWPGIAPFSEKRRLATSCAESFAAAQHEIVPRMGTQGYHLDEEIWPRRLRFVGVTGLYITVMFHPAVDGGTEVSAFGHGPRAVRKAFATLTD